MNCLRCGKPAELVPQYQRWWCAACKEYVPPPPGPPPKGPNLGLIIGLPLGIVGGLLLLAVMIPAFTNYLKKGKASEAQENLQAIFKGAETYFNKEHMPPGASMPVTGHFPAPSVGPTPAATCCSAGASKCMPNRAQWTSDPVWGPDGLNFSIEKPHYFVYTYTVNHNPGATDGSNGFTITANADLDCDGVMSTFQLIGAVDSMYGSGVSSSGTIIEIKPNE